MKLLVKGKSRLWGDDDALKSFGPDEGWREPTRGEYLWFQFTRERFSYRYLLVLTGIVLLIDTAFHLITGA